MTTPIHGAGTLSYAPDTGQPEAILSFTISDNFTKRRCEELPLTGSGTHTVSLQGSTAFKVLLIEVEPQSSGASINVNVNGGTDDIEIRTGGGFLYWSTDPQSGITSVSIDYTADCVVRVSAFG